VTTGDPLAGLRRDEFPRASRYDPAWVAANQMGPNALWLVEALVQRVELAPGMRVLDLGCGKALTSIFLAREFDVQVVASDWWIGAADNWRRIVEAGETRRVLPIHAEAHALPYADDYFDAIVSVDAYHYFGTDDMYLPQLLRFLRPGGRLGIVVPGLRDEPARLPPPHLRDHWRWDFGAFHSPAWWEQHWAKTGKVERVITEWLPGGHELWVEWERIMVASSTANGEPAYERDRDLLLADTEHLLGFVVATAHKT
jgi:cyclopropane fatty-acyl-phospholipid synthase-like methyltransferase